MNNSHIYQMRNLAYFAANFPYNFIDQVWGTKSPHLVDHIKSKLYNRDGKGCITVGDFFNFFYDLDAENQTILCEWITKNYQGV